MSDAAELDPGEDAEPDEEESAAPPSRDRDLLGASTSRLRTKLDDLFSTIARGFEDQSERADSIDDYWDCFNCITNGNQYYNGIAQIYFPIIHDAVTALVTRYVNQMCPQFGRYIEAITTDGTTPTAIIALIEHYLRSRQFETQVLTPLLCNGFIEGQYNLSVDWGEVRRQIVSRETHGPRVKDADGSEVEAPGDDIDDVREDEIVEGGPIFEVLHDSDVLVLPATADSVEEALASGGSVTIVRRWSKARIDQAVDDGLIRSNEGKILKDAMGKIEVGGKDLERSLAEHVGIRKKGGEATVWETWHMLPLDEKGGYSDKGTRRLCRIFFGPNRAQLGAKRNPFWNDRCPLLSASTMKTAGVFKGKSPISYVDSLQYEANDAMNEGADAATLSAAPIVTRDTKAYNGPLVYNVGAVWDIPPDSVKLLTFPDLTPRAQTRVQMAIQAIFQALGVNPSMLPQQTRSGKPNQAQVAQEQQVDLLTTAQGVKVPVESVLTPSLGWCVDLDYQFRDRPLTVRSFGDMGVQAELQEVAPLQNRHGFTFLWRGSENVKMAAMMQQQGSQLLNISMQPNVRQQLMAEGYQLHIAPAFEAQFQHVFGAFLGAKTLIDQRHQLTRPPDLENEMLIDGFTLDVHPLDNDVEHLQAHMKAGRESMDPHGTIRVHMQAHVQAQQMKQAASMQRSQAQQGMKPPGQPGGAGAPQPGAAPGQPHALKRPPGAVHPDRAATSGVVQMPRRT